MRRALLLILLTLGAVGCDSTEPSVPTTVVLTPSAFTFDAIGVRDKIVAKVLDQRGNPMENVPLAWSAEGAAVSISSLGGDSAVVTSTGNGTAIIRAATGTAIRGEAPVTVKQVAATILLISADQRRTVATALAPILASVRDAQGNGVPGVAVTFSVTLGNGTLSATEALTDEFGSASVIWTLGTSTTTGQELTAAAEGVESNVSISATATPGPAAGIIAARGDNQSGATSTWVSIPPTVRVVDSFGNGVPSTNVSFSVVQGGGTVFGPNGVTNTSGEFSVQGWALGFEPGANILRARVLSRDLTVDFRATGIAPPTIGVNGGTGQAAMVGTRLPTNPSFIVRDAARAPLAGVKVNFLVTEGDGTVDMQSAVTDANGIASPGGWTLGPIANRNRISARAEYPGLENAGVSLDAYGCSNGGGVGYAITLCFTSQTTPQHQQVFQTAAQRWSNVIVGDLPNVDVDSSTPCQGLPSLDLSIDDLLIFVSVLELDGGGGLLGQAGPCGVRAASVLPYVGLMQFDRTDVLNMSPALFETVILHEMAHVIGIGSLWDAHDLIVDPSSSTNRRDTYYIGAAGRAGFDAVGGAAYIGGAKVPVENQGGQGTANGHWRESVLRNELMTGFVDAGSNPLSLLSIRSLEDLGYAVDPGVADVYTYTPSPGIRAAGAGEGLDLGDDILYLPLWSRDAAGREVRIR